MSDLRELNKAVQNATFPTIQFAQTVRDWIAAATEMLEHKADSDPCLATFLPAFSGFKEAHVCQLAKGHGGYHESPNEVGGVARWIGYGRPILAEPASEGAKVECPNCLQKVPGELEHWHSGYHDDNYTVEPHYVCEQQISELDDRHNRMASLEAQAKFRAAMDRRAVEIGVDRLVGISAFPVGNCPTCGDLVAPWNKHAKYEGGYTCKPAQPEPAAPSEMPEAVHPVARAVDALITASEYYRIKRFLAELDAAERGGAG